jgi:serine phosphatase RsbU (regulator of sigma subunit)
MKGSSSTTVFFLLFALQISCAFSITVDEVQKLVAGKNDSVKTRIIDSIARENRITDPGLTKKLLGISMSISREQNKKRYAAELIILSKANRNLNDFATSLSNAKESAKVFLEIGDTADASESYNQAGATYYMLGSYDLAIKNYFEGLKIGKKYNQEESIAVAYTNMGNVFVAQEDYNRALGYYMKSLPIFNKGKNKTRYILMLDNISTIYLRKKEFKKAAFYNTNALQYIDTVNNPTDYADILANGGSVYSEMGNLQQALIYLLRAKRVAHENKYSRTEALSMLNLGDVYFKQGKFKEAISELEASLAISKALGIAVLIEESYNNLTQVYEKVGDTGTAYFYLKLYSDLKDSSYDVERISESNEMIERYETEQKEKEISRLEQKNALKQKLLGRNKILLYATSTAGVSLVILALVLFGSYRNKKKANELMKVRNKEIQIQKRTIEIKNKDITDSINYAQRIQQTMLPSGEEIIGYFPESFILFLPKDVVSGDFYWFGQKEGKTVFCAADCTGHGVPGALMSMIGSTLLNETINNKGITKPADILFQLRENIIHALKQTGASGENKDGMDISLCCLNRERNLLEFSGANNPVYLVRNNLLSKIKADKQPIGIYSGLPLPFTNHEIPVQKGDSIYVFTDGFADQFGGPGGKKFKYKQLEELLLNSSNLPMGGQQEIISNTFVTWKGTNEQVDDVCIIGIRI